MRKNYFRDKNVGPVRAMQFAYDIIKDNKTIENEYYTGPGCGLMKQLIEVEKHPEKYSYTKEKLKKLK